MHLHYHIKPAPGATIDELAALHRKLDSLAVKATGVGAEVCLANWRNHGFFIVWLHSPGRLLPLKIQWGKVPLPPGWTKVWLGCEK